VLARSGDFTATRIRNNPRDGCLLRAADVYALSAQSCLNHVFPCTGRNVTPACAVLWAACAAVSLPAL
jgi:hypothetical protein